MANSTGPRTLYDKVFAEHIVHEDAVTGDCLIFIDRHLVHEVTSPQAFEGLRKANRRVRRPDCTLATLDHNIPTTSRKTMKSLATFVEEPESRLQSVTLEENVRDFGVRYFGLDDARQGIVHVIGPEQGFTLPGTTVVCGDSHTSTHGAFGALAFGIGTSEVEHVLATQTLQQKKSKNMRITVTGSLAEGVTSKDLMLHIIGLIGTAGGTGSVIEFCGGCIESLSMEARMSMCNMAIEAGARAGLVAPDDVTFEYIKGRPLAPSEENGDWDRAVAHWRSLRADEGAVYDINVELDASEVVPTVTWGTSPQDVVAITGVVPDPADMTDPVKKASAVRALEYMGLRAGELMTSVEVQKVFIGSCTNSRIEDLRSAARIALGRKVAPGVHAMVVPGSGLVKKQAEAEGIDKIFADAGFDFREAGCSMCLGMNPDQLKPQERCASTSNRNFEGRQGAGGRTHLMSPAMAAAAAIAGRLVDVREYTVSALPSDALDSKMFVDRNIAIEAPAKAQGEAHGSDATVADNKVGGDKKDGISPAFTPFTTLSAVAAPLPMANVDTDMIIPKQFLKTIKRTGLGSALFHALRTGDASFVLNREPFRSAGQVILIAGENFGCGSSREHAVWALADFGIRCVIAPSFGDIFRNNCSKNGVLPVQLDGATVAKILNHIAAEYGKGSVVQVTVDLMERIVVVDGLGQFAFAVDEGVRTRLIQGLDEVGVTLSQHEEHISAFESVRAMKWPWLNAGGGPKVVAVETERQTKRAKVAEGAGIEW